MDDNMAPVDLVYDMEPRRNATSRKAKRRSQPVMLMDCVLQTPLKQRHPNPTLKARYYSNGGIQKRKLQLGTKLLMDRTLCQRRSFSLPLSPTAALDLFGGAKTPNTPCCLSKRRLQSKQNEEEPMAIDRNPESDIEQDLQKLGILSRPCTFRQPLKYLKREFKVERDARHRAENDQLTDYEKRIIAERLPNIQFT